MNKCDECACIKCTCNNKLYPCELDKLCWGCDRDKDKENCKEPTTESNCSFVARYGRNTVKKWQLNKRKINMKHNYKNKFDNVIT